MRQTIFRLIGTSSLALSAHAEFACPPYQQLESCLRQVSEQFIRCKEDMAELLHDRDSLTLRSHAFYMLNIGCGLNKDVHEKSCFQSCQ